MMAAFPPFRDENSIRVSICSIDGISNGGGDNDRSNRTSRRKQNQSRINFSTGSVSNIEKDHFTINTDWNLIPGIPDSWEMAGIKRDS
jgi:hypothetical protein